MQHLKIWWSSPDVVILDQWLELRATRNRHVQSFRCEETLGIKQIEEIIVNQVSQELVS